MMYKNRRITGRSLKFESFMGDIDKELQRISRKRRTEAAAHVKKKLKQKTTQRFGAGSGITEGVGSKHMKSVSLVGIGPPGQHAHLIEFGTDDRYHLSGKRKGRYTGHINADPFVEPVYRAEASTVRKIMTKEWF